MGQTVASLLAFLIYSAYRILPQRALACYNFGGSVVIGVVLTSLGGVRHIPQQVEVEQLALQSPLQGLFPEEAVLRRPLPPAEGLVPR